jgi:hypothetical protein
MVYNSQQPKRKNKKQEEMKLTIEQLNTGFHQVWQNVEKQDTTEFLNKPAKIFQDTIQVTPYSILMELGKLNTSKAPGPDTNYKHQNLKKRKTRAM